MNSVYKVLIELSKKNVRFKKNGKTKNGYCNLLRFDLRKKQITNGHYCIIKDGQLVRNNIQLADGTEYNLEGIPLIQPSDLEEYGIFLINQNPYEVIEKLYVMYKYSAPKMNTKYSRMNFRALTEAEMTNEQILNGMPRIEAQYLLEGYVMLAGLSGWIPWYEDKHFYWQSSNEKSLIIFRDFIQQKER